MVRSLDDAWAAAVEAVRSLPAAREAHISLGFYTKGVPYICSVSMKGLGKEVTYSSLWFHHNECGEDAVAVVDGAVANLPG